MRTVLIITLAAFVAGCAKAAPPSDIVADVRQAVTEKDFARGARGLETFRAAHGVTPPVIEAHSFLAAGAFSAKTLDVADTHARAAYDLGRAAVASRRVDDEPQIATAIGRAIEVLANVNVERGARSEAVAFLERELDPILKRLVDEGE